MTWTFTWLKDWEQTWEDPFFRRWLSAFEPGSGARVSPFMHPAAVRAWIETVGADGASPVGLLGDHQDGRKTFQILTPEPTRFPGQIGKVVAPIGGRRFDFTEPVVFPAHNGSALLGANYWSALAEEVRAGSGQLVDRLEFPRVRGHVLGSFRPEGETDVAPYLDLSPFGSIDDYMASRKGRSRRSLRRRVKRCYEAGDFAFDVLGPDDLDRIKSWIPRIIAEKRRKFPDDTDLDEFEAFLTRLVERGLPTGLLTASCCRLDGRDISWSIDFTVGGDLFLYTSDYDPAFQDLGLGSVHTYHQVEWAIAQGMGTMNFMWGSEAYKKDWTGDAVEILHQIRIDNPRPASRVRLLFDRAARRMNLA